MKIFQKHSEYGFEVDDKRENQSDCENFSAVSKHAHFFMFHYL